MHITLLQENLLKAVQTASRFIATKPQIPVLTGIALRAKDSTLTIQTTDLQVGFQTTMSVKTNEEGEIAVPAKVFVELLHTLSPGPLELKSEGDSLFVKQAKVKSKLPTFPIAEFPPFSQNSVKPIEIPIETFKSCVEQTLYAASLDETRPVLASLLFNISENQLTCVCTDGYRLSVMVKDLENAEGQLIRVLLPAKALNEVMSVIAHSNTKIIYMSVASELSQVFCTIGDVTILLRMVEGEFPPYEKIIPSSFTFETILDREEWISALRTAMIFARENSSVLSLEFNDGICNIRSAGASVGENEVNIVSSAKTSETKKISFNGKFLLDVLLHIQEASVIFKMNDELKPGLLLVEGKEYPLSVVMPFKR